MKKFALLLTLNILPNAAYAITQTIPSGSVSDGGDVNSVVTQQVYGEANNYTVSGNQQIMSGGLTHNSTINPGGQQNVESGGTSYNTAVQSNAYQFIKGKSYSSSVSKSGSITVNSGGYAEGSTVNGGTLSILQGGSASGTILQSGTESVTGTDSNATIKGGLQQIKRYGKSTNATISGGEQRIDVRGVSDGATINGGQQTVYGDSLNTKVNSGGLMTVYSSGYAEDAVISGGDMVVKSGGFSSQTSLEGGTQTIYGQDINGTISGGTQIVLDGGVADTTTIEGGLQQIGADSYAFNNIVNGSGVQEVETGGYSYRSQVSDGGTVNVFGGVYEAVIADGGKLNIQAEGLSQDITLSGGTMTVAGTDSNAQITSGTQNIENGGTAKDAIISGSGVQNILAGGQADNSTVSSGGTIKVSGISNNAIVNEGGIFNVLSGGLADGTKLTSATMTVAQGGTSQNTIFNDSTQTVFGTDSNAQITSGTQNIENGGIAKDAIISGSGVQNILAGGQSDNSTVSSGGTINVSGISNNAIVNEGGIFNVLSGGLADGTKLTSATMMVAKGGTSQNTIFNDSTQTVFGTDINAQVTSGTQNIENGGTAKNATISGSGVQNILAGGQSDNSTVSSGGTIKVSGISNNATVNEGGIFNVLSGGLADGTKLTAGIVTVDKDAISQNGTMNGGQMTVAGTDIKTQINGGTQLVEAGALAQNSIVSGSGVQQIAQGALAQNVTVNNGGKQLVEGAAEGTVINVGGSAEFASGATSTGSILRGGRLNIDAGAVDNNTTINSGFAYVAGESNNATINYLGSQTIQSGGKATSATVNSTGTQNILAGGEATKTIINKYGSQNIFSGAQAFDNLVNLGGRQNIYAGGNADNTTLVGGVQIVYGTATNTTINSGLQEIKKGGIADNTQVTRGGIQTVLNGGTANNTRLDNGTLRLQSGGILTGTTIANNSIVNISGNNTIPDLQLDNTLVNISYNRQHTSLNIDNLNGNGVFHMNTNLAADMSDTINVQNGDGRFGLFINDYSMGAAPNRFKIIDKNSTAHDVFYIVGGEVDVGAFRYQLIQDGNDWYLANTDQLTDNTYVAKNTYNAISTLFYSHLGPVYNRLHTQHQASEHSNGLWTKGIGRRINQDYQDGTGSRSDVYGGSLGYDHEILHNDKYRIRLGAYSGYTKTRQKFDSLGRGEGETQSFGLYTSIITQDNWFMDAVGTYFIHDQKTKSNTPNGSMVDGSYDTDGWQAALIGGRHFDLADNWFVEPFAGMHYMRINSIQYQSNFNTLIDAPDTDYLSSSIGITGGKNFSFDNGLSLATYSQAKLSYDWDAKTSVTIADYTIDEDMASLHYEFGAGVNASWNDHNSAYVELSTELGAKVDIPWEINVGYQYEF